MKLWKKLLLGLLGLVVILLLAGFVIPSRRRIERSLAMKAPATSVFPEVAALRRWPQWTAWTTERFPDMKTTFRGPESGAGSVMTAEGKSSGNGTVTITSADPARGVWYDLDFERGTQLFRGAVTWDPSPDGLKVSWSLETEMGWNPIKRWGGLFLDGLMGGDMAEGLAKLKRVVESSK